MYYRPIRKECGRLLADHTTPALLNPFLPPRRLNAEYACVQNAAAISVAFSAHFRRIFGLHDMPRKSHALRYLPTNFRSSPVTHTRAQCVISPSPFSPASDRRTGAFIVSLGGAARRADKTLKVIPSACRAAAAPVTAAGETAPRAITPAVRAARKMPPSY